MKGDKARGVGVGVGGSVTGEVTEVRLRRDGRIRFMVLKKVQGSLGGRGRTGGRGKRAARMGVGERAEGGGEEEFGQFELSECETPFLQCMEL